MSAIPAHIQALYDEHDRLCALLVNAPAWLRAGLLERKWEVEDALTRAGAVPTRSVRLRSHAWRR